MCTSLPGWQAQTALTHLRHLRRQTTSPPRHHLLEGYLEIEHLAGQSRRLNLNPCGSGNGPSFRCSGAGAAPTLSEIQDRSPGILLQVVEHSTRSQDAAGPDEYESDAACVAREIKESQNADPSRLYSVTPK